MGVTVREKPDGSGTWWIFVSHRGRRTSKKIGKKEQALVMAEEIRHQLARDQLGLLDKRENKIGFGDYVKSWLENYIRQVRANGTYTRYRALLEQHIRPLLGSVPLVEISRRDIREALLKYMRTGASKSSVGLMHCVISGALNHAVDDELIQANPGRGLTRSLAIDPKIDQEEIKPLTPAEVLAVLSIIAADYPAYYPVFLALFRTGARVGELCALRWDDVNLRDQYINIRSTARDQHVTDRPKTPGSRRRVDISAQLAETLRALHQQHKKEQLQHGGRQPPWVFQQHGKILAQNTLRRIFARALVKAGLDHRRIHDIRHTYASTLLHNGTPIVYVSKQLGHKSIKMTVDIYGHLIPSADRSAVNTLDDQSGKGYTGKHRSG